MITAAFSTPASDWTRAISDALSEWSKHLVGQAALRIEVVLDANLSSLASAAPASFYDLGRMGGQKVFLPFAAWDILTGQNNNGGGADIRITVNPDKVWHFGAPETTPNGAYSAVSVMTHEIGHGLFMIGSSAGETPFTLWASEQPDGRLDGAHFAARGPLMYGFASRGPGAVITAEDIEAAGQSGLATNGDDLIFIPRNAATVDAGGGNDTAVWLTTFSNLSTDLVNFETLRLDGANPLTAGQFDLYRLYEAAFDRAPDLGGFRWWEGSSLATAANGFVSSAEFTALYGQPSHADLITALYANILDREPDAGGYQYWLTRTDLGPAELLTSFALSAENNPTEFTFIL